MSILLESQLNRDVIISSLTVICDWNDLDNGWATKFLREAERLEDQENFKNLKDKSAGSEGGIGYVKLERCGFGLRTYWKGIIEQHKRDNARARLKIFAYKVISYDAQQIPEEFQESVLCGVCLNEINPQISEPVTILICGHIFHHICLKRGEHNVSSNVSYTVCQDPKNCNHEQKGSSVSNDGFNNGEILPELNNNVPSGSNIDDLEFFSDGTLSNPPSPTIEEFTSDPSLKGSNLNHISGSNSNHVSGSVQEDNINFGNDAGNNMNSNSKNSTDSSGNIGSVDDNEQKNDSGSSNTNMGETDSLNDGLSSIRPSRVCR
ncbi:hypothetical protein Glove_426g12 [Diversispora epigaea]|uniref:RING-type domain-containing protein n=1 Tax=Diversispora epigaea TaxID=1348612 RepID=A0A397GUV1_9GLOM|nr:hypothetical protein Glove_426g12 [Diversispora epigaea]